MFGFPVAPRTDGFQLRQNLLRTVVFQVKFPPTYAVLGRQADIRAALIDAFPEANALQYQQVSVAFGEQTPIVSTQDSQTGALEFRTPDHQKIFSVAEDELLLTILGGQYVNFSTAQHDLQASIYRVASLLGLPALSRVAVRKINLVNFQPIPEQPSAEAAYRAVFNSPLTVTAAALPAAPHLFSAVSNYHFQQAGHRLNLVYGLLPDSDADGNRQLVLDIDLANTAPDQPYADLADNFAALNAEVFNIFSWCTNPALIQLFNAGEVPPAAQAGTQINT